jgi:ATP-dependent DNA helicase RecG
MTATPIPATLNMVLFGDMDVSVIDEMPPAASRSRPAATSARSATRPTTSSASRSQGPPGLRHLPAVEESDTLEEKAAVAEAVRLQEEVFPDLRIALLHGRMPAARRTPVMAAMRAHEHDILVATSVIEVGIDIPNATVMIIEGADRFGLAQLHQFGAASAGAALGHTACCWPTRRRSTARPASNSWSRRPTDSSSPSRT